MQKATDGFNLEKIMNYVQFSLFKSISQNRENLCFIQRHFQHVSQVNLNILGYWPSHHRWDGNIVMTMSDGVSVP